MTRLRPTLRGMDPDAPSRSAARLAMLAMARGGIPAMFGGDTDPDGTMAAMLYLAGRPVSTDGGWPDLPEIPGPVLDLLAASAVMIGTLLYIRARDQAGLDPSREQVEAAFDEAEAWLLAAETCPP